MNLTAPQHFQDGQSPKFVQQSNIGTVYIYEGMIVTEFKEGVNVSYATGFNLLLACLKHIGNDPFTVVSNRINSYSVKPTDYKFLSKVPNLMGVAIVARDAMSSANAMLEAKFFTKSFGVFNDLQSAKQWSEGLVSNYFTD